MFLLFYPNLYIYLWLVSYWIIIHDYPHIIFGTCEHVHGGLLMIYQWNPRDGMAKTQRMWVCDGLPIRMAQELNMLDMF
jgi:hypothetical protein